MDNFDSLKQYSLGIVASYLASERPDFQRYAERILNCAPRFDFRLIPGELRGDTLLAHIQNVRWCRCRQCPLCQWAKVSKWRAKFFRGFSRLHSDFSNYRWIFLTFTVRNCPVDRLRLQIDSMAKGWHRLLSRRSVSPSGYIRSFEVTRSQTGEAHPHYHALLLMPPEYFSESYLNTEQWVQFWRESANLDYDPVVYVRSVQRRGNQGWVDALLEVVKYSVKPSDLAVDAEWLYAITDQLKKTRSVTVGGLVSQYVSQKQLDAIESNLTAGDEQAQVGIPVSLEWNHLEDYYEFV
ncbi:MULTISPECIES: protein rep [unclassified Coleofasciculus]|uniref:protein rep n=1 Tax=unclassified Coleofasciculus TaxID=2692782 RepID=UPI00188272A7|nr:MULTISPECIES: protein rep [unclassified Coleofasciculus]MBE9124901.1 protein rep [Coleofasciculus sp. LEGE 07081]MBE9147854.1 protein rep [Coleofasciculus sp. LEGE 07092]